MNTFKVLVVCKDKEDNSCDLIQNEGFDIIKSWKNTFSKKDLENIDFVISIGGDGTALSASHYLIDKPLLAVNSSPSTSVGALTTTDLSSLPSKLEEIKNNKHKEESLERIQVFVNDKPIETLALNDVFIANEKAYLISKYNVSYKGETEFQFSSGLIFSTGTGSTAWFKSAGGTPFSPQSKFIEMIVREPYYSKFHNPSITKLKIKPSESVEITIGSKSILAIDSIREYSLDSGDRIKVEISSTPLKRII
jgi:NAD kinase